MVNTTDCMMMMIIMTTTTTFVDDDKKVHDDLNFFHHYPYHYRPLLTIPCLTQLINFSSSNCTFGRPAAFIISSHTRETSFKQGVISTQSSFCRFRSASSCRAEKLIINYVQMFVKTLGSVYTNLFQCNSYTDFRQLMRLSNTLYHNKVCTQKQPVHIL